MTSNSREGKIKEGGKEQMGNNGHKSNWVTILKTHLEGIKGPGWINENLATIDGLIDAIKTAVDSVHDTDLPAVKTDTGNLVTRLGTPAAGTVAGDVESVETKVDAIDGIIDDIHGTDLPAVKTQTDKLGDATIGLANLKALIDTLSGYVDNEVAAILAAVDTEVTAILADTGELQTDWANGGRLDLLLDACALEATLTAIKGAGWTNETLKAIKDAIDALGAVNQYQEQIPDTDFSLAAIDSVLTANPPGADAENSVVDIDAIADTTFVLRGLWVNVTSFGTGTKLTFKLWVPMNGAVTNVDSVDVTSLGIQNLADIFGLQEVHADSIHITIQTDAGNTGACAGTYRYAKAS